MTKFFRKINHKPDNILIQGIRFVGWTTVQQNIDLRKRKVNFISIIEELESLNRIKMVTQEKVFISSISALRRDIGLTVSLKPCPNSCSFG